MVENKVTLDDDTDTIERAGPPRPKFARSLVKKQWLASRIQKSRSNQPTRSQRKVLDFYDPKMETEGSRIDSKNETPTENS